MQIALAKLLLLTAGAVGVVVGLLTFIGGICAAEDKSNDDIMDSVAPINYGKYWCGMRRIHTTGSCDWDHCDRGWFRRVHDEVKDEKSYGGQSPDYDELKKLAGYAAVLSYAIICGLGWIAAGALALFASMKLHKMLAMIAGITFAVLYLLFVALFGAIWDSVKKVDDDCDTLDNACSDIETALKRSSREFLAYSIIAFILILYCIVACFLFWLMADVSSAGEGMAGEGMAGARSEGASAPPAPQRPSAPQRPPEEKKAVVEQKKEQVSSGGIPPAGAPTKKEEEKKVAKKKNPEIEKITLLFRKVNKYLVDENKLTTSANKKFDGIDNDHSGHVNISELKTFIDGIMKKKGLPSPKDRQVEALLKKYDKDASGQLEKEEFRRMLKDIFSSSRLSLIKKYATLKAADMKDAKKGSGSASGIPKVEALLKNMNSFESELMSIARQVDKDKSSNLDPNEVTLLVGKFCQNYSVPTMDKAEIQEIMEDMDRPIGTYNPEDLKFATYAILTISKNIVKS